MTTIPPRVVASLSRSHLPRHHPLRRVNSTLKVWLAALVALMAWSATVANGIALHGWVRPLPFVIIAAAAVLWTFNSWSGTLTAWCSAVISVGLMLRAVELLLYGRETYDHRTVLTAASLWAFIAITTLVLGFLNIVVISRRTADIEVWGPR